MSAEEMHEQLYELINDRKSLIGIDEEADFIYKKDIQAIEQLQQEIRQLRINLTKYKKLEDNWNELKNFLENNWKETQDIWFVKIINKMQELERGVNDVEN